MTYASHPFRLDGSTVVVTGGDGRIGAAAVAALVACGARVVSVDRQLPVVSREHVTPVAADVSDPDNVAELVDRIDAAHGFAAWVNAAYPRTADWGRHGVGDSTESWRRNLEMQLTAVCRASERAAGVLARRGGGAIVNVASIYGMVAPDFAIYEGTTMTTPAAYAAIKGGLIAHTRYLAAHYGRDNVRVNVVAPGGVAAGQDERFVAAYSRRTALGRMARAEEIGPPVAFLCSAAASYVTGALLPIDGGWTAI